MADDRTMLVVDDEQVVCQACRRIFSRQGFQVESNTDARQGLKLATEKDYTIILLDIKMPNINGIEFLERLREKKSDVPVLIITGYPEHSKRGGSHAAGGLRLRDQALHVGRDHVGRSAGAQYEANACGH